MSQRLEIPDHPDIARTLLTGYPHESKGIICADCEKEMYGDEKVYISDGDTVCGDCLKERILEAYDIDDLADAFDIRRSSVNEYLEEITEE